MNSFLAQERIRALYLGKFLNGLSSDDSHRNSYWRPREEAFERMCEDIHDETAGPSKILGEEGLAPPDNIKVLCFITTVVGIELELQMQVLEEVKRLKRLRSHLAES